MWSPCKIWLLCIIPSWDACRGSLTLGAMAPCPFCCGGTNPKTCLLPINILSCRIWSLLVIRGDQPEILDPSLPALRGQVLLSLYLAYCCMCWQINWLIDWLKVIGTHRNRSVIYDFLLVIHSIYGPISYRFRDKGDFGSKNTNLLSHLTPPMRRLSLEFCNASWTRKVVRRS